MAICKTHFVCVCVFKGEFCKCWCNILRIVFHTFSSVLSIKNGIIQSPSNVYLENWLGLRSAIFTLQAMETDGSCCCAVKENPGSVFESELISNY